MSNPGLQLKKLRLYFNMTQSDFADAVSIKRNNISMIESGRNKPTFELISTICETFNLTADYFLSEDNPEKFDEFFNDISIKRKNIINDKSERLIERREQKTIFNKTYVDNDAPLYLELHAQKKIGLEFMKGIDENSKIYQNLNTLLCFQYIISNLDHYYFEGIDKKQHEVSSYYDGKTFDFEKYRNDILLEIDKVRAFAKPLDDISKAIEKFYSDLKPIDIKNIITGFFTGES
ncbi:helix-turn-helix transcriptional regulator [Mucilaginibacter sp.]|uniref:helix-turn-helix domain-containing protein n=1 Tax=Mucilaginibacter sp. TaxID=1882438 RepID=UPI0025F9AACA|nr:helix-turn-helix transcriptional regulator [Mucilaginibacter sp.]